MSLIYGVIEILYKLVQYWAIRILRNYGDAPIERRYRSNRADADDERTNGIAARAGRRWIGRAGIAHVRVTITLAAETTGAWLRLTATLFSVAMADVIVSDPTVCALLML